MKVLPCPGSLSTLIRPAVQLDELLREAQAQPRPFLRPGGSLLDLLEGFEDASLVGLGDPHAAVADRDLHVLGIVARGERHAPAGRGELDRIGEQVEEHLPILRSSA